MRLREQQRERPKTDAGYAMAGMLVAIAVSSVMLSMLMPAWSTWSRREKEAELIFRGEQYVRAIELFQRQSAGAYPPDVQTLVDQRFLRQAYTDPVTGEEFDILTQASVRAAPGSAEPGAETPDARQPQPFGSVTPVDQGTGITGAAPRPFTEAAAGLGEGGGGVIGVVSRSADTSMALYNGRSRYDEWLFVYLPQAAQPGVPTGLPQGAQPGAGGVIGGFGEITGQPPDGAGARGGRQPGAGTRRPGVGSPLGGGPGTSGSGAPPRR